MTKHFDLNANLELMKRAKEAEFFETPDWAANRILDFELLTPTVLDPCAGRGVLGEALRSHGYDVHEFDLNKWPGAAMSIKAPFNFVDEWEVVSDKLGYLSAADAGFSVMMNPPFSLTCEFVERSFELGARKVLMFQRFSFSESGARKAFFDELPPSRIWLCGDRANCWRGDMPDEDVLDEDGKVLVKGKKGRSTPTAHAWFVWERHHNNEPVGRIYKE